LVGGGQPGFQFRIGGIGVEAEYLIGLFPGADRVSKADARRAVLIAGPTASGKSALALEMAQSSGGWIVNTDAMQVYDTLRIVTARPSPQDESRARHELYGFVSCAQRFSTGRWLEAVRGVMAETDPATPLIFVGGTGLYFDALTKGFADVPEVPAEVAAALEGALAAGPRSLFGPVEATYVSSTLHGDWLARVGAHQLGDRALARVSVLEAGVLVERDGPRDVWVPVETIRSAQLAPGMAGKYVGADGLVVLTWAVPGDVPGDDADEGGPVLLDTGVRTRHATDRGALVDAVRHLIAAGRSDAAAQDDDFQHDNTQLLEETQHHRGDTR
jgi:hypothetical protein